MKQIKSILLLVIGITIGFSVCKFFSGNGNAVLPSKPVADLEVTHLEKNMAETQKDFEQRADSLNVHEMILSLELNVVKSDLAKAKRKNLILQTQVYDLVDKNASMRADTLARLIGCDSLQVKVVELIHADNEKDSLYESAATNMEQQLKNRDSTIALKQQQYQSLKTSFDMSLLQQKLLAVQNEQYRKHIKRQKIKQKILSLGALVLSGLTANYLLTH